jgi:hypothetical protein
MTIPVELGTEVLAKKLRYRARALTPSDLLDLDYYLVNIANGVPDLAVSRLIMPAKAEVIDQMRRAQRSPAAISFIERL